jgi:regulation of enolase protein 1 (concanavalin A-like superfamily)
MEWLNEPASWQRTGEVLTVSVDPGTDFWRETGYGYIRDSGHVYGDVLAGDLDVSVRLRCTLGVQYDQAGVMLRADERTWLKTGVEFFEGRARLSTVLTLGRSSWMVTDLPGGTDDIVLRVSRRGDAVEVRYVIADGPAELAALVFLPPGREVLAGVMAAAPEGPGFQVTFHDLRITERDWSSSAAPEATAWAEQQADWAAEQAPEWTPADGEPGWAAPEAGPDTLDWPATAAEAQPPAWSVPAAGDQEANWPEQAKEGDDPGWPATTVADEAPDWAAAGAEHDLPGWAVRPVADEAGPETAAMDEPAHDESGRPGIAGDEPAEAEPEPLTAEPTHAGAAEPEPMSQEPADQELAEQEPAEQEPADQEPAEHEPADLEDGDRETWAAAPVIGPTASDVDPAADWERLAAGAQAPGTQAANWRTQQTDVEVANEWPGPPLRAAIRNGLLAGGALPRPAVDTPDEAQTDPGLPQPDTTGPAETGPGQPEAGATEPEASATEPEASATGPAEAGAADQSEPEREPSARETRRGRSKRGSAGQPAEPDAADEWINLLTADPAEE